MPYAFLQRYKKYLSGFLILLTFFSYTRVVFALDADQPAPNSGPQQPPANPNPPIQPATPDKVKDADKPQKPASNETVCSAWYSSNLVKDCLTVAITFVANLILGIAAFFLGIVGLLLDFVIYLTVTNLKGTLDSIKVIPSAWTNFRDMANMFFIFVLLYISIGTVLQYSGVKFKAMVTDVVIYAIFINFSLFATSAMIDISNLFTLAFYHTFSDGRDVTISSIITNNLKITSLYDTGSKAPKAGVDAAAGDVVGLIADTGKFTTFVFAAVIFMYILGFIFLVTALLFIGRFVTIVFLLVLSPLAFAGYILPRTQKYSKEWFETLLNECIWPPFYMALMSFVLRIIGSDGFKAAVNKQTDTTSLSTALTGLVSSNFGIVLNFVIVIAMLIGCLKIAEKMGSKLAGSAVATAQGIAGAATVGLAGKIGRNTIGKAANSLVNSKSWQKAANSKGWRGGFGLANVGVNGIGKSVAEGSYDVRGAGLQNLGSSYKGGYAKERADKDKQLGDFVKNTLKPGESSENLRETAEFLKNLNTGEWYNPDVKFGDKTRRFGIPTGKAMYLKQGTTDPADREAVFKSLSEKDRAKLYDTRTALTDDQKKGLTPQEIEDAQKLQPKVFSPEEYATMLGDLDAKTRKDTIAELAKSKADKPEEFLELIDALNGLDTTLTDKDLKNAIKPKDMANDAFAAVGANQRLNLVKNLLGDQAREAQADRKVADAQREFDALPANASQQRKDELQANLTAAQTARASVPPADPTKADKAMALIAKLKGSEAKDPTVASVLKSEKFFSNLTDANKGIAMTLLDSITDADKKQEAATGLVRGASGDIISQASIIQALHGKQPELAQNAYKTLSDADKIAVEQQLDKNGQATLRQTLRKDLSVGEKNKVEAAEVKNANAAAKKEPLKLKSHFDGLSGSGDSARRNDQRGQFFAKLDAAERIKLESEIRAAAGADPASQAEADATIKALKAAVPKKGGKGGPFAALAKDKIREKSGDIKTALEEAQAAGQEELRNEIFKQATVDAKATILDAYKTTNAALADELRGSLDDKQKNAVLDVEKKKEVQGQARGFAAAIGAGGRNVASEMQTRGIKSEHLAELPGSVLTRRDVIAQLKPRDLKAIAARGHLTDPEVTQISDGIRANLGTAINDPANPFNTFFNSVQGTYWL